MARKKMARKPIARKQVSRKPRKARPARPVNQSKTMRPGTGMSLGIALGVLMGIPIGIGFGDIAIGIGVGIALGAGVGCSFEAARQQNNTSLRGREMSLGVLFVVIGIIALTGLALYLP